AAADDAAALARALVGAAAVVNCAGPLADTAHPLAAAAPRAGAQCLDVCAEQAVTLALFERHDAAARAAGLVVAPSMAFYGALGDLLATAAMDDWPDADAVTLSYALDRWWPTGGTRATARRSAGRHLVYAGGRLEPFAGGGDAAERAMPAPFGVQAARELATADQVTIPRHLAVREVRAYMTAAALDDLRDPATPPPAGDASGTSPQRFVVEAEVARGAWVRRAAARERGIYASSAPIVAEAAERVVAGRARTTGVAPAGALFEAADFLWALAGDRLQVELP
ncbi:hypothetical protein, partial [Roseisolibacter sp. H3M3-2]|uniref:hypothetical protein n=1 Tax=Roseisolibacter sp. H3M3-2 TaxID=3031323 RepID=UPI0023DC3D4A